MTEPMPDLPPLFLQDRVYDAQADRLLLGAMVWPYGDTKMYTRPRPGVRPSGTLETNHLGDMSFRVDKSGNGNELTIAGGIAYVPGQTGDSAYGIYLVVSTHPMTVSQGLIYNPAADTDHIVWLVVYDTMLGQTPPSTPGGDLRWDIVVIANGQDQSALPVSKLKLASVKVSKTAGVAPTVTDGRQFTTNHGGMLLVNNKATDLSQSGSLVDAPLGSSAYAYGENQAYLRTTRGWEKWPVIVGLDSLQKPVVAENGELWYDSAANVLYINKDDAQGKNSWLALTSGLEPQMAHNVAPPAKPVPAAGTRVLRSPPIGYKFQITGAAQSMHHLDSANIVWKDTGTKPPDAGLKQEIWVNVQGGYTMAAISIGGKALVHDKDDKPATNQIRFGVDWYLDTRPAVDVTWNTTPADEEREEELTAAAAEPDLTWDNCGQYFGQRTDGVENNYMTRTFHLKLTTGKWIFRPVFGGSVADLIADFTELSIEVALL